MGLGKKGVFYLFLAIIFLMIVVVLQVSNSYNFTDAQEPVTTRVQSLNDFVLDLNNDAHKATFIAAYRSLIAMEEEISLSGEYLDDAEETFGEAFYNGTINGLNRTILNGSSFSEYLERVRYSAAKIGILVNIKVKSVRLYHEDPWRLSVDVTFTNNLTDALGMAGWNYEKSQSTLVPLVDLRDPVYSVGTLGRVPSTIKKTNYSYFVYDVDNANDTTNLMAHVNESKYIESNSAPSFLMRLEGNFSNSTYGIESLVNIAKLVGQGLTIEDRSIVDHVYFNPDLNTTAPLCDLIINTPVWFQIDEPHLKAYEIDPKLGPENEGYRCLP